MQFHLFRNSAYIAIIVWMVLIPMAGLAMAAVLSFTLDAPDNRAREAALIAEQLAEAGMTVEINLQTKAQLRKQMEKGERQAYLTDWGSSFFDPYDLVIPKLSTGGHGNFSFYSNPLVDELLSLAATSTDADLRRQSYRQVQEIILAQSPWAFGYMLDRFEALSNTVQGYHPALDGRVNLHDVRLSQGDTLTVALDTTAFLSLDPAAYRDRETETVVRNLFDALLTRTPAGEIALELAESYETPAPDTYIFTLRPGVRFHNGQLLTAADVVFTFERIINPFGINGKASPRRELLGPLVLVEALADNKVRFVLEKPFPLFLQALVHFQIVPKKYLLEAGYREFAEKPIGTGPFIFVGGQLNSGIEMERFADYYGGSPELPPIAPASLRKVVFRPLADSSKRLALLHGPGAVIVNNIPYDMITMVSTMDMVTLEKIAETRSFELEMNNAKPPFNDIRVRKAVSLAIDWQAVVEKAYLSHGQQLTTCFLPTSFGYAPELHPVSRNLENARLLLQDAGYSAPAAAEERDDN